MYGYRKYTVLSVRAFFLAIVLPVIVISAGCKRKPAEPNKPEGTGLPGAVKPQPVAEKSLSQIIQDAKTWTVAFKQWQGKLAPEFTLVDIAGKEHKLSNYRGKYVIITFWATYCGACRLEIPHLMEIRNTIGQDGLAILAISKETPDLVKKFAAQQKINYTAIAEPGPMPSPFDSVEYTPTNFFIDSQGRIKLATIGLMSADEIKAVLQSS
jgi:peroxiredoxin